MARFNREIAIFARRWPDILKNGDPYYNPNLTLRKSNFALRDLLKEKIGEPYKLEVDVEQTGTDGRAERKELSGRKGPEAQHDRPEQSGKHGKTERTQGRKMR